MVDAEGLLKAQDTFFYNLQGKISDKIYFKLYEGLRNLFKA